jgi:menaquinone-9 beta-reductase
VERFDVVIAGGGIAGSGAATVLAGAGRSVCVVEPTTEYPDIVRGEWMAPWGVAHSQATGVYDVLIAAGGHHIARHIGFDEGISPESATAEPFPLDGLVPGVPGPLAIRHPVACQALADAAAAAGAVVHRGATDIELRADRVLSFAVDGQPVEAQGRIVVGADGRSSPVRKAVGIELEKAETGHFLAGVLLDGLGFLGDDTIEYVATEGGLHSLCFPQGGGRARVYLNHDDEQAPRFGGAGRAQAYLAALEMACWPGSAGFRDAEVIGPARGYRSVDTWCERPYADGVVLIGDAAGHNDPLIGQGLSIASADVRAVTEALLSTDDWSPGLFEDYGRERHERMRRLRATARVYALAVAGQYWARQPDVRASLAANPLVTMFLASAVVGPYVLPDELYDRAGIEQLLQVPAV